MTKLQQHTRKLSVFIALNKILGERYGLTLTTDDYYNNPRDKLYGVLESIDLIFELLDERLLQTLKSAEIRGIVGETIGLGWEELIEDEELSMYVNSHIEKIHLVVKSPAYLPPDEVVEPVITEAELAAASTYTLEGLNDHIERVQKELDALREYAKGLF